MNSRERYRTGTYDLEVLTLPRTMINDVVIQQDATTVIQVPQAGTLNLQFSTPGHGSIFLKEGSELRWVAALDGRSMNALYRLQPGEYRVLYRSINSRQTIYSIEKEASIQSDRTITLNF
jgi:Ca-activated chloride channel family protein